jgi:hypothetical protein
LRRLAAELLANTGWAGLLVYSGALFVESYREPTELVGAVLAVVAGAYVAGNLALRRVVHREGKQLLVRLALSARPSARSSSRRRQVLQRVELAPRWIAPTRVTCAASGCSPS